MAKIEIDENSGFCFGVVTAIRKAEEELHNSGQLYCLGDIVHNSNEVERLQNKGLLTITHAEMGKLSDVKVLLRAHGEPPETYRMAQQRNIEIIDATCPVVLQLQKRISDKYHSGTSDSKPPQIVIYGKNGHAEVNGLVGQTDGNAVVIENIDGLNKIDFSRDIFLYSQTTKSLEGFKAIEKAIAERIMPGVQFQCFDTICRNVANRIPQIREFARNHDLIFFVAGEKSSNGKILFEQCRQANPQSYLISNEKQIDLSLLKDVQSIGVCGATSTPMWLMNQVKTFISRSLGE